MGFAVPAATAVLQGGCARMGRCLFKTSCGQVFSLETDKVRQPPGATETQPQGRLKPAIRLLCGSVGVHKHPD